MKQKLIVTLWRGHIDSQSSYESVFCRLTYSNQQQKSKAIQTSKSLTWKQTFIFALAKQSVPLKLDFINMHQIQQIHFAQQQVLDGLSIGKSETIIQLDNSNRGTVPAKLHIHNSQGNHVGTVFIQYEILKTQVTYVVQKLIDYQYLLKIKSFKLTFIRGLPTVPSFYLKFKYGDRQQKQDFSFQQNQGIFMYNYPVKFFMKNQNQMIIELQFKQTYKKDYKNPNTSLDSQSVYSNNLSVKSNVKGSKKNLIDIQSVQKLSVIFDLAFKKDGITNKKLPVLMQIKNNQRQIGTLQFDAEVIFRTKKQKQQYQIQKKRELELKDKPPVQPAKKKKQKKYQIPKNGQIQINSIIGKLQLFNEEAIKGKNASIQLKLGKVSQNSVVLQNPGKQIIWMDTFQFKRTWEQTIKFIIYIHFGQLRMPKYYTSVNLRYLFQVGRYMAKKLELKDESNNYCGYLVVDIVYKQQQQKPKSISKKVQPVISAEEKEQIEKQLKKQKIMERMKLRQQNKKKRQFDLDSVMPTFSEKQLLLPPLRSSRNISHKSTLSPKKHHNISVNIYNNGGAQIFSRSPRFQNGKQKFDADSFFFKPQSDFETKKKRGASIGLGQKYDFTRQYEKAPGVGRYQIPSVWDKYN